jgi:hypothetical protein
MVRPARTGYRQGEMTTETSNVNLIPSHFGQNLGSLGICDSGYHATLMARGLINR